jgi:hypothetical protein
MMLALHSGGAYARGVGVLVTLRGFRSNIGALGHVGILICSRKIDGLVGANAEPVLALATAAQRRRNGGTTAAQRRRYGGATAALLETTAVHARGYYRSVI